MSRDLFSIKQFKTDAQWDISEQKEKMKKMFVMLFALVSVSLTLLADNAAQCKIAGGDGSTATVSLGYYNENTKMVTVYFSNDSNKPTTICCKINGGSNSATQACALVPPASEVAKEVYVSDTPSSVTISSARCESK